MLTSIHHYFPTQVDVARICINVLHLANGKPSAQASCMHRFGGVSSHLASNVRILTLHFTRAYFYDSEHVTFSYMTTTLPLPLAANLLRLAYN
ncbi:hypothetical protein HanRHA438_Chr08g0338111 [Helianthus annuus]|nr:hypothetical protein HanRHA438_Chr08g0338111 [Helianthus annuus]